MLPSLRSRQGGGEGVEAQLTIEIAACSRGEFVESIDSAHDPCRTDGFGKGFEFLGEGGIAQHQELASRREFEQVGQEAVENGELLVESCFPIFGERSGACKELGKALRFGGAIENAERVPMALLGGFHVHFKSTAGAALGELSGKLDMRGLPAGFFLEQLLDLRERQGSKMELHAARDDGAEQRIGRRSDQN